VDDSTHNDAPPSGPARRGGFLQRAAERAKQASAALREEYRKGTEGDTSPVQPIAPTAGEVFKRWAASEAEEPDTPAPNESAAGESSTGNETGTGTGTEEADEVADLLRGVDWDAVRRSVSDSATVARMRDLASQVDWRTARPVAARVAAALVAAAASGQVGRSKVQIGRYVARTIANETGLAERVAQRITGESTPSSAALVRYIDTTASEAPAGFDGYLDGLGQIGGDTAPDSED
jgi:hypothetical protein